ncbi:MAG: nickel-binding protein [Leeuwenhoekiella sp.]
MPIYMDRHDVAEEVTAQIVAELHQEDLRIQDTYHCRGLTYWYDDCRKTAFCLIEAPNKEAIVEMHANAHGEVPNTIIEVDDTIVESFLGRIEDPKKSRKSELNIVNDPAFRILVVLKIVKGDLQNHSLKLLKSEIKAVKTIADLYKGRIVKQKDDYLLLSYTTTTTAVNSALEIQRLFTTLKDNSLKPRIGISSGVPVTVESGFFEKTIKTAERLSDISNEYILITSEVKDLYESENLNHPVNAEFIRTISISNEYFLNNLVDYLENEWHNPTLGVDDFCANLGLSTSQLYRKMTAILEKTTNSFLQDFRLKKALKLLERKDKNISEIAFETGFNSAAYFTKCFQKKYGITPSVYSKNS